MPQSRVSVMMVFMLLVVVAAVVVGVAVLVWLLVRPRKAEPASGGKCGQCGYGVRGIASTTCPECGADLREVGIVAGERPRGGGTRAVLIMLAAFVGFMCVCSGMAWMVRARPLPAVRVTAKAVPGSGAAPVGDDQQVVAAPVDSDEPAAGDEPAGDDGLTLTAE